MYRNIIFDLGGVVVDFHPRTFLVDRFMNERLEQQLYDITFGSEEWLALDAGFDAADGGGCDCHPARRHLGGAPAKL